MTSFLEKLKKGMSIQEPLDDIEKIEANLKKSSAKKSAFSKDKTAGEKTGRAGKKPDKSLAAKEQTPENSQSEDGKIKEQPKKIDIKPMPVELKDIAKAQPARPAKTPLSPPVLSAAMKNNPKENPENNQPLLSKASAGKENWLAEEGELAIDIYQTEKDLVIQSAIAGINPEDLEVVIEKDIIRVKGLRKNPLEEKGDYFTRECFWGSFKREIILPVEVDSGFAEATMKEGILTIRLPKILREKKRVIKVKS